MVQPISDEALEQVGPPQKRAIGWRDSAERQMVAATGPGVPPIEHELLGS